MLTDPPVLATPSTSPAGCEGSIVAPLNANGAALANPSASYHRQRGSLDSSFKVQLRYFFIFHILFAIFDVDEARSFIPMKFEGSS